MKSAGRLSKRRKRPMPTSQAIIDKAMTDPAQNDSEKPPLSIDVQCYAGYRGEQEPRRFFIGRRKIEVVEIADRWLAPDHRYFKVQGDDGAMYILRHDETSALWEIIMYDSGRR